MSFTSTAPTRRLKHVDRFATRSAMPRKYSSHVGRLFFVLRIASCVLRRIFYAIRYTHYALRKSSTTFRISIVVVKGPTPPGTGVMNDALADAPSNSMSPTILSPTLFIPTSMTIALSFIQSPFILSGLPTAVIRISARLTCSGRTQRSPVPCQTEENLGTSPHAPLGCCQ